MNRCRSSVVFVLSWMMVAAAGAQDWVKPVDYEAEPTFAAADIVARELIYGPHHLVSDQVPTVGYLHQFHIDSEYGAFDAEGVAMLETRVKEIAALEELVNTTRSEAFISAMAKAATGPYRTAVRFVSHPVKTITGIPGGIGRFLKGVSRTGGKVAKSTTGKDDDESSTAEQVEDAGTSLIGLNSAKRKLAADLGVDPYSRNEALQAELERVAWANTAGGLVVKFAVPGIAVVGYVSSVEQLVWNLSPAELEALNAEALQTMGVDKDAQDALFGNDHYTPTLVTLLVRALSVAPPNTGQQQVVELAASVDSEAAARFMAESLAMLEDYHTNSEPLISLLVSDALVSGITAGDRLVLCLPVDYLSWTEEIDSAISAETLQRARRNVRLAGDVSTVAAQEIVARGWHLTANTRLTASADSEAAE